MYTVMDPFLVLNSNDIASYLYLVQVLEPYIYGSTRICMVRICIWDQASADSDTIRMVHTACTDTDGR